ncbi:RraA family protein [Microbacterium lacticum]
MSTTIITPPTASVSDALDSLGLRGWLEGITARVPGAAIIGPAYTVTYKPVEPSDEFRGAANYIDDVPAGAVIVVDNGGSTSITTWGSLLTVVAHSRGIAGTIIHGTARDIAEVRDRAYPLFTTGIGMTSGKNRVELAGVGRPVDINGVIVRPGDIIVADDNGAVSVPSDAADEVLRRARNVSRTEERIAEAVLAGERLDEARKRFAYHRPWEDADADRS